MCALRRGLDVGSIGSPTTPGGRRQRRHEVRTPWRSAFSTSSRSASGRRARTPSGRCGPRCSSPSGCATRAGLEQVARVRSELFGSLGATGHGHGSDKAVLLGLTGERPELCDPRAVDARLAEIRATKRLSLLGQHEIDLVEDEDLVLHRRKTLPLHPNGMTFTALDATAPRSPQHTYYSVGGGFVVGENADGETMIVQDSTPVAHPVPHRRRAARPLQGDRQVDRPHHARERAVVAHRGRRSARACSRSGAS